MNSLAGLTKPCPCTTGRIHRKVSLEHPGNCRPVAFLLFDLLCCSWALAQPYGSKTCQPPTHAYAEIGTTSRSPSPIAGPVHRSPLPAQPWHLRLWPCPMIVPWRHVLAWWQHRHPHEPPSLRTPLPAPPNAAYAALPLASAECHTVTTHSSHDAEPTAPAA